MSDKTNQLSPENDLLQFLKRSFIILNNIINSPQNVVIFALDRQYRYLSFNKFHSQVMKQIWGEDIEIGHNMFDYIKDPADYRKAKVNFDRALSGESFIIEEEYGDKSLARRYYHDIYSPIIDDNNNIIGLTLILIDITERKTLEIEKDRLIAELQAAQAQVETLSGMLPICANCKKIRDDKGYWNQVESYIEKRSGVSFSHGICPDCMKKLYPWFKGKTNESKDIDTPE